MSPNFENMFFQTAWKVPWRLIMVYGHFAHYNVHSTLFMYTLDKLVVVLTTVIFKIVPWKLKSYG